MHGGLGERQFVESKRRLNIWPSFPEARIVAPAGLLLIIATLSPKAHIYLPIRSPLSTHPTVVLSQAGLRYIHQLLHASGLKEFPGLQAGMSLPTVRSSIVLIL